MATTAIEHDPLLEVPLKLVDEALDPLQVTLIQRQGRDRQPPPVPISHPLPASEGAQLAAGYAEQPRSGGRRSRPEAAPSQVRRRRGLRGQVSSRLSAARPPEVIRQNGIHVPPVEEAEQRRIVLGSHEQGRITVALGEMLGHTH